MSGTGAPAFRPNKGHPAQRGPRLVAAIGVFRLFKAVLLVVVAAFTLRLVRHGEQIADVAKQIAERIRLDPHNHWLDLAVSKLTGVDASDLKMVGLGTLVYAGLYTIEGVGLIAGRVWAEWLTVASTSLLLPFEVWHLLRHPTVLRAAVIVVNAAIVAYLLRQVRRQRARPAPVASGRSSRR